MSSEFLRRGLLVLSHVAGQDCLVDVDAARRRAEACTSRGEKFDFPQWYTNPESYLILQDWIPRRAAIAAQWQENADRFLPAEKVESLINDVESDPHLFADLVALRSAVELTGYDADNSITTTSRHVDHLILFGTGDGHVVSELINRLDPTYLTIVVTEWEDWASSFWVVDWGTIWNERCLNPDRSIFALRADDANSLATYLADANLPLLEHAACYCAPTSAASLRALHSEFNSTLIQRLVLYTGFVMDEYNMIWNSWYSLLKKPRVFHAPSTGCVEDLSCIVCGSGPSLDACLPEIKKLSASHLIIACASNYGTLRSHGIDVDILCLLERGDFMIDQYRAVVDSYGAGSTRLLASVTTPAELQEIFHQPMVYFRPALTPLAVFADSPQQVLVNEGPQSINTGIAFAAAIGAGTILLAGVDLGVADRDQVRSRDAIGESPRDFPLEHPGNFVETAYTNSMLIDGKVVVEKLAVRLAKDGRRLFNCSNGILIEGFTPISATNYLEANPVTTETQNSHQQALSRLWTWWGRQPEYQPERFKAKWATSRPRQHTRQLIAALQDVLASSEAWSPQVCSKMSELLKCTGITRVQQFPRRVIRGQVLKLMLAVTRQLIVMTDASEQARQFELAARQIIARRLCSLELEIYDLLDAMEGLAAV